MRNKNNILLTLGFWFDSAEFHAKNCTIVNNQMKKFAIYSTRNV